MDYQDTSREAYASHEPKTVNERILAVLESAGARGCTREQIWLEIPKRYNVRALPQTVSGNIAHLIRDDKKIRTTKLRRKLETGRMAAVLVLPKFWSDELHRPDDEPSDEDERQPSLFGYEDEESLWSKTDFLG